MKDAFLLGRTTEGGWMQHMRNADKFLSKTKTKGFKQICRVIMFLDSGPEGDEVL